MSNFIRMKALGNLKVAPNVPIVFEREVKYPNSSLCINQQGTSYDPISALKEEPLNNKYWSLADLRALFDVEENPLQNAHDQMPLKICATCFILALKMTREFVRSNMTIVTLGNLFFNKGRKHTNFGCKDYVPLHPWDVLNSLVISVVS